MHNEGHWACLMRDKCFRIKTNVWIVLVLMLLFIIHVTHSPFLALVATIRVEGCSKHLWAAPGAHKTRWLGLRGTD